MKSLKSVIIACSIVFLITACEKAPSLIPENEAPLLEDDFYKIDTPHEEESHIHETEMIKNTEKNFEKMILNQIDSLSNESDYIVGWIKINGTNVDHPLVQGPDNSHFLNHDFRNNPSDEGAIYIDYRNFEPNYDNHLAIYGHFFYNGTMFHDLHNFKTISFAKEYPVIEISNLYDSKLYAIFSIQIVSADNYYLIIDLDKNTTEPYLDFLKSGSIFEIPKYFNTSNKLITLVTCTYEFNNARLLIHALEIIPQSVEKHFTFPE